MIYKISCWAAVTCMAHKSVHHLALPYTRKKNKIIKATKVSWKSISQNLIPPKEPKLKNSWNLG